MIWTRLRNHRTTPRIGAVDDLQFPAGSRQRLADQHPHLSADDLRQVEAATRQWFRLLARQPTAKMSMPSVVAGALWQQLALHTRDYATFCDAAFGQLLPYQPAFAIVGDTAGTDRIHSLLTTLGHARRDEAGSPAALPMLFRVDQNLRIPNGNRYLADCGGRGECFHAPGLTCLQHLTGPGKQLTSAGIRGSWPRHYRSPSNDGPYPAELGGVYGGADGSDSGGIDGGGGD